jgi:beta-lactamase class A
MDTTIFKREFDDLGITEPRFNNPNYTLNVKEYSMLFNALYSAGYLRKQASENALALLSESTFKNGLLKYLPRDVVASHKFGESGNGVIHELHESGIIYLDNSPYLLTIMTRGKDWDVLSETIGQISKKVYDRMALSSTGQATAGK